MSWCPKPKITCGAAVNRVQPSGQWGGEDDNTASPMRRPISTCYKKLIRLNMYEYALDAANAFACKDDYKTHGNARRSWCCAVNVLVDTRYPASEPHASRGVFAVYNFAQASSIISSRIYKRKIIVN